MKKQILYYDVSDPEKIKEIMNRYISKLKGKNFVEFKLLPKKILKVRWGKRK